MDLSSYSFQDVVKSKPGLARLSGSFDDRYIRRAEKIVKTEG
jgi:hypothetical protein